jgi:hypothetical protein
MKIGHLFLSIFKIKKEFQKNKNIFRFFSIPKNRIFSFLNMEYLFFGGCFGMYLKLMTFQKNKKM